MQLEKVQSSVRSWVENVVIGLDLCPFAGREWLNERVRLKVSTATTEEALLEDLQDEISLLDGENKIETTLLIHPCVLQDFYDYNAFLDLADALLADLDRVGIYQLASFHPHYQFAGATVNDISNYTNRSPYPMLHLIREESLEKALAHYPDSAAIPEQNMARLRALGLEGLQALVPYTLDSIPGEDNT